MRLYKENGKPAGLDDVIEWWCDAYPTPPFIGKTPEIKIIVNIREAMEELLAMREVAK